MPAYAWFRFVLGYAVVPLTTALKADPVGTLVAAWPWVAVVFGLGLLGVVGLLRLRPGGGDEAIRSTLVDAAVVIAVAFAVPFAISLVVPMYGERYLGIVQPLALLVLTTGLAALPRRLASSALRGARRVARLSGGRRHHRAPVRGPGSGGCRAPLTSRRRVIGLYFQY